MDWRERRPHHEGERGRNEIMNILAGKQTNLLSE